MTSALLHSLWQGTVVAFALAVALIFVKSARLRYALACLALLALPAAFVVTMLLSGPAREEGVRFPVAFAELPAAIPVGEGTIPAPSRPFNPVPLWLTGAGFFYAYRALGLLAALRLRHRAVCAAPLDWRRRVEELSARIGLRRPVLLLESALAETPLTVGAIRPVILLPLGLLSGMPVEHIEAVILHELAHIRRHDYLVNLAQTIIEGLFFYHPATWWISHIIRREREHCCDDIAVAAAGDARVYTQALAALEERRIQVPILAATGGPLMSRIHRLLTPRARTQSPVPALIFLVLASAALALAFHPEPKPEPAPAPAPMPAPAPAPDPVPAPQPPPAEPVPQTPAAGPVAISDAERARMEARLRDEIETPYKKWLNEEVVWIISDAERNAFNRLETDDERQMFIEQFWLRRDPTPDTEANEFKEEHYRRIAWANDRFAHAIPGWMSDRGMIYVKFGPPDEREEHPAEGNDFPYERWRYKYLEGVGNDVVVEFVDRNGDNTFRMTWDPNDKNALLRVPGAGLTLYEQLELAGRNVRFTYGFPAEVNMFERMRRFVEVRRRPAQ